MSYTWKSTGASDPILIKLVIALMNISFFSCSHIAVRQVTINIVILIVVNKFVKDTPEYSHSEYLPIGFKVIQWSFPFPDA